ncbi:hypothetical protein ACQY1Q_16105 [Tenacibaculum sp. TC6]|uniref:hypothetical protein n=1 Tax=Tenacibaculum sp. TC6 TaxID=3423223 RepID=UPI003D369659
MNKLQKLINLKYQLKNKSIDNITALKELHTLINTNDKLVSEFTVYKDELDKLLKIKEKKADLLDKMNFLNENSNDIMEFLSLDEEQFKKVKNFGYQLI